MAANSARRSLQFSCSTARTILSRSSSSPTPITNSASTATKLRGHSSFLKPKLTFSRPPVELGAMQSMMPLHSVTASALLTSLLSLHNSSWGCLSEGFATPL